MKKSEIELLINELVLKYEDELKGKTLDDMIVSNSLSYFNVYLDALKYVKLLFSISD